MRLPTSLGAFRMSRIDLLLVGLVLVWGVNYSLIKQVFQDIDPMPFNAARFTLAAVAFLVGLALVHDRARRRGAVDSAFYTSAKPTAAELRLMTWLGLIGHCGYHLVWATGLSMTTASNSALIMGAGPVAVATATALLGHERIRPLHWVGIAVSLLGVIVVVGRGAAWSGPTLLGDALTMVAVGCWTFMTIGGSRLMHRHSPLYVSAMTTTIGTIVYVVLAVPTLGSVSWLTLGTRVWLVIAFSGLFSTVLATVIWYAAVQRIGAARTSAYSNLVPLAVMVSATYIVDEPLTAGKLLGAGMVLIGVGLTRLARPAPVAPLEE